MNDDPDDARQFDDSGRDSVSSLFLQKLISLFVCCKIILIVDISRGVLRIEYRRGSNRMY